MGWELRRQKEWTYVKVTSIQYRLLAGEGRVAHTLREIT